MQLLSIILDVCNQQTEATVPMARWVLAKLVPGKALPDFCHHKLAIIAHRELRLWPTTIQGTANHYYTHTMKEQINSTLYNCVSESYAQKTAIGLCYASACLGSYIHLLDNKLLGTLFERFLQASVALSIVLLDPLEPPIPLLGNYVWFYCGSP